MDKNLRPYMAELIGTFAFVFLSAGAVCVNSLAAFQWQVQPGLVVRAANPEDDAVKAGSPVVIQEPSLGLTGIALATGLAYAVALAVTLPISGGFLNPVVPLALWVYKRLDGAKALWLIGVQLLGAALAGGALRALLAFPELGLVAARLGTPHVNLDSIGLFGGIGVELLLTFFLVFAIFGMALDPRASRLAGGWASRLVALWLGLFVSVATLVGLNLTGAALSPARWFGTVIWEMTVPPLQSRGPLSDQAVYWIGPTLGALIAGAVYTMMIQPAERDERAAVETSATTSGKAAAVTSTLFRARK